MDCLGKIFWGIVFLLFIAALIWAFSIVVIFIFGMILIAGVASLFSRKKPPVKYFKDSAELCRYICGNHNCSEDPYCPLEDPENEWYQYDKKFIKDEKPGKA